MGGVMWMGAGTDVQAVSGGVRGRGDRALGCLAQRAEVRQI